MAKTKERIRKNYLQQNCPRDMNSKRYRKSKVWIRIEITKRTYFSDGQWRLGYERVSNVECPYFSYKSGHRPCTKCSNFIDYDVGGTRVVSSCYFDKDIEYMRT